MIDNLFIEYKETKDLNILLEIAPLLANGERPNNFIKNNPEDYNKIIKRMVRSGLIGKEKDGVFTAKENDRTFFKQSEKGLEEIYMKPSGAAEGFIASQNEDTKKTDKEPTSYLIKEGSPTDHLLEVTGARFYRHFAGNLGSITAKTRLVEYGDEVGTGSRMIEGYSDFFRNEKPEITPDGKVMSGDKEVKGYIANLVVAKFIQDFDALGYGPNLGMQQEKISPGAKRNLHSAIKIDPGNSFGFIPKKIIEHDPDNPPSFVNVRNSTAVFLGISTNIQNATMNKTTFNTTLPLDFVDPNDPLKLRSELGAFKDAVLHVHPNIDTRDILLDGMTYAKISQHQKPYTQMAKTLEAIARSSDETLSQLIYENMPDVINQENVKGTKDNIFRELKKRREIIKELYAQEIEYVDLYRKEKKLGHEINFEELKARAAENVAKKAFKTRSYIPINNYFKDELEVYTSEVLLTTLEENQQGKANDIELAEKMMLTMIKKDQDFSEVLYNITEETKEKYQENFRNLLLRMPDSYSFKQEFLTELPNLLTEENRKITEAISNLTNYTKIDVKLDPKLDNEVLIPNQQAAKEILIEMIRNNQDITIPLSHIPKKNLDLMKETLLELQNSMTEGYLFKNKFQKSFLTSNAPKPRRRERNIQSAVSEDYDSKSAVNKFRNMIEEASELSERLKNNQGDQNLNRAQIGIKGLLNKRYSEETTSPSSISSEESYLSSGGESIETNQNKISQAGIRGLLRNREPKTLSPTSSEGTSSSPISSESSLSSSRNRITLDQLPNKYISDVSVKKPISSPSTRSSKLPPLKQR